MCGFHCVFGFALGVFAFHNFHFQCVCVFTYTILHTAQSAHADSKQCQCRPQTDFNISQVHHRRHRGTEPMNTLRVLCVHQSNNKWNSMRSEKRARDGLLVVLVDKQKTKNHVKNVRIVFYWANSDFGCLCDYIFVSHHFFLRVPFSLMWISE